MQKWFLDNGKLGGLYKKAGKLEYKTVSNAGHMVPYD